MQQTLSLFRALHNNSFGGGGWLGVFFAFGEQEMWIGALYERQA